MELFVAAGIMMRAAQVIFLLVFTRLTVESCSKPRAFIATEGMSSAVPNIIHFLYSSFPFCKEHNKCSFSPKGGQISVATRIKLNCIYAHNLLRSTLKKPV